MVYIGLNLSPKSQIIVDWKLSSILKAGSQQLIPLLLHNILKFWSFHSILMA